LFDRDQKQGLLAAARIFESIEESKLSPIDGLCTEGQRPALRAVGRIELKNVTFRYPTRPDVEVTFSSFFLKIFTGMNMICRCARDTISPSRAVRW